MAKVYNYTHGILVQGAKVPGNESSRERKSHVTFPPGSESSRERKYQGTKVSGNESTRERKFQGAKVPGSEIKFHLWYFRSQERKYVGTKVSVTGKKHCRTRRAVKSARVSQAFHSSA